MTNERYDVRQLVRPRTDKRGRLLGGFESLSAARHENQHRILVLRSSGDPKALLVAEVLAACRPANPCGSLACSECGRIRRIKESRASLRFLDVYPPDELRLLTLINPVDARRAGQLHTFDPALAINRTRRQLERAGIDKSASFSIGQIDGEWDEGRHLYQPHLHAIALGVDQTALKTLVEKWPRARRVRSRKRLEPIDDLPRVVAYLDKTFWPSVARKNNPLGIHPHQKHRPPKDIEVEILIWMNSHKSNELLMLFAVKNYQATFVKS